MNCAIGMTLEAPTHGVKRRAAASFGLPDWVRLNTRPPNDVLRLIALTRDFMATA